jgi:hypothetical protein
VSDIFIKELVESVIEKRFTVDYKEGYLRINQLQNDEYKLFAKIKSNAEEFKIITFLIVNERMKQKQYVC